MIWSTRFFLMLLMSTLLSSCSNFAPDKQVMLPPIEGEAQVELVDLRPDTEITRTNYGATSVADDRQFAPPKVQYLANELSKVESLDSKVVELVSFRHDLDTRSSSSKSSVGQWLGPVGTMVGGSMAAENGDSISCSLALRVDGEEYVSKQVEYFKLGSIMMIEWEKPQLREAAQKVTVSCVNDVVSRLVEDGQTDQ